MEIFMLCWNLPSGPKHRGWLQKNIAFQKRISWFRANLDETNAVWFNLQRDGTRNGLSNIKETFSESLQLQMSVLHQRMSIFLSSMPLSQVHMMAGQIVKKKYPCQIPNKMLRQEATPNSSLHNLKICLSKWCRKTSQRWIYVATYQANTAILNIRISSRRYHLSL